MSTRQSGLHETAMLVTNIKSVIDHVVDIIAKLISCQ